MTILHEAVHPEDNTQPADLYEQRAHEIGALIDPEHTLPQITLAQDNSLVATNKSIPYLVCHDGNEIGSVRLITQAEQGESWARDPTIVESLRGKGYGTALYLALIQQAVRQGLDFRTDIISQTESAKKMWEHLTELGVAEEIEPFYLIDPGQYMGHYVIRAT